MRVLWIWTIFRQKIENQPKEKSDFNNQYIKKVEPLTEYLVKPKKIIIDVESMVDFITHMNVLERLGAFLDQEAQDDEEYEEDLE